MELNEKELEAFRIILKAAPSFGEFNIDKIAKSKKTVLIVGDPFKGNIFTYNSEIVTGIINPSAYHVEKIFNYLSDEGFATKTDKQFSLIFTDTGRELKKAGSIDEYNFAKKKANRGAKVWDGLNKWLVVIAAVVGVGGSIGTMKGCQYASNDKENKKIIDSLTKENTELKEELKICFSTLDSVLAKSAEKDSVIMNQLKIK